MAESGFMRDVNTACGEIAVECSSCHNINDFDLMISFSMIMCNIFSKCLAKGCPTEKNRATQAFLLSGSQGLWLSQPVASAVRR